MKACADCRNKDTEILSLRRLVASKNMALEELRAHIPEGQRRLYVAFKNYQSLVDVLTRALWMEDPKRSSAPSPTRKSSDVPEEGKSTRRDRRLVRRMDHRLGELVHVWSQQLGTEHQRVPLRDEAPRCRRRDCGLRGRRQALDARECRSCFRPFADTKEES